MGYFTSSLVERAGPPGCTTTLELPLAGALDSHRARHNRRARRCYWPPPRLHFYDPRRASSRRRWRLGVSRVLCDQQSRQDYSFSSTSPGGFNEGAAGSRGHGGDRPSWRGGSSGYYHASGCLIVRTELRARCRFEVGMKIILRIRNRSKIYDEIVIYLYPNSVFAARTSRLQKT